MSDPTPKAPVSLDAAIDLVLAMPMCFSTDAEQRALGEATRERLCASLDKLSSSGPTEACFVRNLQAEVWAASRGFASARKFFEEEKARHKAVLDRNVESLRGLGGLGPLSLAGAGWRALVGAVGLVTPAFLDSVYRVFGGPKPGATMQFDEATIRALANVVDVRLKASGATTLSAEAVSKLDGLISRAAERAGGDIIVQPEGPFGPVIAFFAAPGVAARVGWAAVGLLVALLAGEHWLRGYTTKRIDALSKRTADFINDDWEKTRAVYEAVLTAFVQGAVRNQEDYYPGSGYADLSDISGTPIAQGPLTSGAGLEAVGRAVAMKMTVRVPQFDGREVDGWTGAAAPPVKGESGDREEADAGAGEKAGPQKPA